MRKCGNLLIVTGVCLMTVSSGLAGPTLLGPCSAYSTGECFCNPWGNGYRSYFCKPQNGDNFCEDQTGTCLIRWTECPGPVVICADSECSASCITFPTGSDCTGFSYPDCT